MKTICAVLAVVGGLAWSSAARAADETPDLKKMIEELRKRVLTLEQEKAARQPVGTGVDKVVDNKYGPNATVSTKQGKLTVGGLVQVWYYSIQNDNLGYFGNRAGAALTGDTNEAKDNDSFALRRVRLNFTMDVHENVTGYVQLDLANAFGGRPSFGSNLGLTTRGATTLAADTNGNAGTNILMDAWINYHGVIPHHDFTIGQFCPMVGLDGPRAPALYDFAEVAIIDQITGDRDVGIQAHGTWLDDRLQYWLGAFNTPSSFLGDTTNRNRVDNNDEKSFVVSVMGRPVWKDEKWGSLELSFSAQFNKTGESGPGTDGLGIPVTDNIRYYAYGIYAPGGPVKGWWMKGEYAWIRGRVASNTWLPSGTVSNTLQTRPRAFDTTGWYVSTGYKISDSIFANDVPGWFKPFEFLFRYDTYGNIQAADLVPSFANLRHDVFKSSIYTAGINYYIKGHNAKIQVDYNWALEGGAGDGIRHTREVRNDNLMVNFQVAW